MAEGWITADQAAKHLSVSRHWLYTQGKELNVPRAKVGGCYRYKISELDNFVLAQSENYPINA